MAKSFNQIILVGNMARDPELKKIPSGQSVASFAVATNRQWTDSSGEKQEQADFHNIVAWGKLGELVDQYLQKGSKVMIVGRLQTRSWEAEDGSKRYRTEIVASDVSFLDRPGENSGSSANNSSSDQDEDEVSIEDLGDDPVDLSEIPF
ncbi:MAG: single-stranded DNA-binding protein [Candidatus Saccharimonadales bacterium]